jgi:predicted acylesterase/phospholipase RssA/MinD-like ATPase involved in chromosome partitioning or flagellar assembly
MPDARDSKIITFYSYKGGTGRSMAVANVAWVLACAGKKVLAIDWDLEAPGLHRYFYPFLVDKELSASDGIIDFVINYVVEAVRPIPGSARDSERRRSSRSASDADVTESSESTDPDWYKAHANILRYALSLNYEFPKQGRLDFVPAGRQGISYASRVNSFDWRGFHDNLGGGTFLEEAKTQMRAEYDYVLIDSRTGESDTSGICTFLMPDIIVPCFTLNNQGMEGALRVTKTVFEQRKESGLRVFPVPMRLDNGEAIKLSHRRQQAKSRFFPFPNHLVDGDWDQYWNDVAVFYVPYYSYEEVLAMFVEGREPSLIFNASKKLAGYLLETKDELLDFKDLPTPDQAQQVLDQYAGRPVTINLEAELGTVAENAFVRLPAGAQPSARRIILRLFRLSPSTETDSLRRVPVALDVFPLTDRWIVHELCKSRLLRIDHDAATERDMVTIAQDEILRGWPRLRQWIQEDREFLLWLAGLIDAQEKWQRAIADNVRLKGGSTLAPVDFLLKSPELITAQTWLKERDAEIYRHEREFIEASRQQNAPAITARAPGGDQARFVVPTHKSDLVSDAKQILRGRQADPIEMLALAKKLKAETQFSYARRLLTRASTSETLGQDRQLRENIFQQLALCTYKDQDLPADERLDRALTILGQLDDFQTTTNQETLGLIGSIYKRKWEVDNQRQNLERSLFYYLRGFEQGPVKDQGYTGINAAFVLDQLASLEGGEADKAGRFSITVEDRRQRARDIRQQIIQQVIPLISDPSHQWVADQWWYYATVAEAHFGLKNYDEAVRWLQDGQRNGRQIYEWELEACARQLATLARLQEDQQLTAQAFASTPAFAAIEAAFGADAVPRTAFTGKIGLALSGGGFRASLFHLGTLARLAELDVLRSVEVLSCVSGGSIVGAHYYLMVRHLLETRTEHEITRDDYINIVREMINDFTAGVQKNIRTRVAADPINNLRMFFSSKYSRTSRAAELYEEYLYKKVKDGGENAARWLNQLKICPLIERDGKPEKAEAFAPKYENWRREAKVPILVINAATLNTGHTWQFTSSWMGETPAAIDSEIDGNDRLRRMYYEDAPAEYQRIRLGQAVGSSAAVPGVFEPVTMDRLYPDRIIRLVDGGVCDNQGIASLLEQDCRVVLVSDGSGQMESQPASSRGIFGVLLRTNSIFQARIREAEYHDLKGRRRSGLLRGLMFVHLKADLEVDPIDWLGCLDPYDASDEARPASRRGPLTRYGIAKDIQELLSGIRTDLDSFSEAESYALMTSAYRMTEYQFKYENCVEGFNEPAQSEPWKFLEIEESMKGTGPQYDYLKKLLAAGSSLAFKVWQIDPWLKYGLRGFLLLVALMIIAGAGWWWNNHLPSFIYQPIGDLLSLIIFKLQRITWALPTLTLEQITSALISMFGVYLVLRIADSLVRDRLGKQILLVVRWKDTLRRIAVGVIVSTVGFALAVLHLYIFDKRFLKLGRLSTVLSKQPK